MLYHTLQHFFEMGHVAFAITKGALVILSTPPAMINSASPHMICLDASIIACSPDAHKRLTVLPATVTGKPASNAAILATLRLSSPAWFAAPAITSSIAFTSTDEFLSNKDLITCASRSSGRMDVNVPPYLPTGVRLHQLQKLAFILNLNLNLQISVKIRLNRSVSDNYLCSHDKNNAGKYKNIEPGELEEYFEELGEKKFRAKQVYEWLWLKQAMSFDDMTNLSKELRQKLGEEFTLPALQIDATQHCADGTIKAVLKPGTAIWWKAY